MILIYVLKEKIEPKLTTQWESLNDKQDKKRERKENEKGISIDYIRYIDMHVICLFLRCI